MKLIIDNYKGFEISLEKETGLFSVPIGSFGDNDSFNSNSFTNYLTVKEKIDRSLEEFISIEPFYADLSRSTGINNKIKIVGIKKDGNFIYENKAGQPKELIPFYSTDYIVYNPENDSTREEISTARKELRRLDLWIVSLDNTLVRETLENKSKEILKTL